MQGPLGHSKHYIDNVNLGPAIRENKREKIVGAGVTVALLWKLVDSFSFSLINVLFDNSSNELIQNQIIFYIKIFS